MIPPPPDVVAALDRLGVSRETASRLERFVDLVLDWNERINLIGRDSAADIWRRHVLDCAQIAPLLSCSTSTWPPLRPRWRLPVVDIGSGAGFPGLVLAVLGIPRVELVESQRRKCEFLRKAAETLALEVVVHNVRVEDMAPRPAGALVARALAPLPRLLELAQPLIGRRTRVVLLKGEHVEAELTTAHKFWKMSVTRVPSITHPSGVILVLEDLRHAP